VLLVREDERQSDGETRGYECAGDQELLSARSHRQRNENTSALAWSPRRASDGFLTVILRRTREEAFRVLSNFTATYCGERHVLRLGW